MESRSVGPLLIVVALMMATSMAASRIREPLLAPEAGVRLPLPSHLGRWSGHELLYCIEENCGEAYGADEFDDRESATCPLCGGELDGMAPIERRLLPAGTEIWRSIYRAPGGGSFFVSVVIGGRDRLSLHRPENCLPGQGLSIRSSRLMETPLDEGSSLSTRLLEVRRQVGGSDAAVRSYFAYWYVAPGRETPSQWRLYSWMAADRLFRARMDRWAYVAIALDFEPSRAEDALSEMNDFIAALYPRVITSAGRP